MTVAFRALLGAAGAGDEGGGGDPGGDWTPADLPNLVLWLKASDLTLDDGDPVSSWPDASGNSNDAAQATSANQPTYKSNIVNGEPVVRFDGTNDYLATASLMGGGTTVTVASGIGNYLGATAGHVVDGGPVTNSTFRHMVDNNKFPYLDIRDSSTVVNSVRHHLTTMGAAFKGVIATGDKSLSPPETFLWVNGDEAVNRLNTDNTSSAFTAAPLSIGARVGPPLQFLFKGDIAELIVMSSVISSSDRTKLQAYFADKYGF